MELLHFYLDYWKRIDPRAVRKQKVFFGLIIVFNITAGIMNTLLLKLVNDILNMEGLSWNLLWAFCALVLVMPVSRWVSQIMMRYSILHVVENLYFDFCRRLLVMPLSALERKGMAKFTASLSEDLTAITSALQTGINVFMQIALILSCLVYFFFLSPPALGITVVVMAVLLTIYGVLAVRGQRYLVGARKHYGDVFDYFHALIEGNKELKLHADRRQAFLNDVFAPSAAQFQRFTFLGNTTYNAAKSFGSVIYFLVVGLILFGLGPSLGLAPEVMSGFILGLLFMISPMESLVGNMVVMDRAKVSVRQVTELGVALGEAAANGSSYLDGSDKPELPPFRQIRFEGATFTYNDAERGPYDAFQLGPIDLSIEPGEVIFITGGNGSGKTTFGKMLTGLYRPSEGRVFYNDQVVDDENRDDYRQLFTAVFVDYYLFETLLGLEGDALDETATKYLEQLQIADKVTIEDGRLSTTQLSMGQRKRLALLTAFLEERPIYVFDEWTANQDPSFRDLFYSAVLPELQSRGKTVVVITHDDQYFDRAERFIKFDFGRIVQDVKQGEPQSKANPNQASRARF